MDTAQARRRRLLCWLAFRRIDAVAEGDICAMKYLWLLVIFVCGCKQPSSSSVGRYVPFDGGYGFETPLLLDTEQGVLYILDSQINFNKARVKVTWQGEEVPDSLKTHWIPITEFRSDLD